MAGTVGQKYFRFLLNIAVSPCRMLTFGGILKFRTATMPERL